MKIHKQNKKAQLVCDMIELQQIAVALSESPNLTARKLALKMTEAFQELANKENQK